MKLIGFKNGSGASGSGVMIGVVVGDKVSALTDVESFYADLPKWTAAAAERTSGDLALDDLKQAPAVRASARVVCVGLNYRAHAAEGGYEVPPFPVLFGRWAGSLSVDGAPVPAVEPKLDWEGELAVVIGAPLSRVSEGEAMKGVFGYAPFNDISARTYQRHTAQWTLGKNADGSGPIGPIVTADAVGDPADGLKLQTKVNGTVVQQASTADMIYSIARVISYISEILTLEPGDVIATGTPEGVGHARTPPWFMKPGDVVEVEIEKVGRLRNPIVAATDYYSALGR